MYDCRNVELKKKITQEILNKTVNKHHALYRLEQNQQERKKDSINSHLERFSPEIDLTKGKRLALCS